MGRREQDGMQRTADRRSHPRLVRGLGDGRNKYADSAKIVLAQSADSANVSSLPLSDANHKPNTKMTTITDTAAIAEAFIKFEAGRDGAFATCRCLPGQWEQENCQEWAEHGTLNGEPAKVYYMFKNSECESEDAGDYPWDADHITKIDVAEADEDGDFEQL